jgi:type III restriction enzyme
MITVANRTETAARIKFAFDRKKVLIEELCEPERTLHIDSKVLREAESIGEVDLPDAPPGDEDEDAGPPKLTKKQQAELLRQTVDTVGQPNKPGAMIQNVISVGMLSEGWDAKTVTHIMGLRAFSSQLLCEQVVGRGLRRTSYELVNGRFEPEYVNIFGVPFTFIPHEDPGEIKPRPPKPTTRIEALSERSALDIEWPNVIRIDREYRSRLDIDFKKMKPLAIDAYKTVQIAELAPMVAGKPNFDQIAEVDLEALASRFRRQRVVFEVVRDLYDQVQGTWKGSKEALIGQLVGVTDRYLDSGLIEVDPPLWYQDPLKQRVIYTLNLGKIVRHLFKELQCANTEQIVPVLDTRQPIRRASEMLPWHSSRPCFKTSKSIVNMVVLDSKWEGSEAFHLDHSEKVRAWVKNDHLGFEIYYSLGGIVRRYRPDYLIALADGTLLILETKGQVTEDALAKKAAAEEWVDAVNAMGGFGTWRYELCDKPQRILDVLG